MLRRANSEFLHPERWQALIDRALPDWRLTPLRIAAIYAFLGMAALYASDVLLVERLPEPSLSRVQALKGGVEVLATAGLIFVLTRRSHARLRETNEHLDRQRVELQILHRVLRHNLRNDLNVIRGYAERIRNRSPGAGVADDCEQILATAEELDHYTTQAKRIRKVTEGNGNRYRIDLAGLVPAVIDSHPECTDDVEVTTSLPETATAAVNAMFEQALEEVITNAIKHADDAAPQLHVDVVDDGSAGRVEVRVIDDGPGIPDEELAPLRQQKEEQLLHVSGMGLWFVDWTLEHSDGELLVTEADTGGTEVRLRVPRAFRSPIELPPS